LVKDFLSAKHTVKAMNALTTLVAKQVMKAAAFYSTGCVTRSPLVTSALLKSRATGIGMSLQNAGTPLGSGNGILRSLNLSSPVGPSGVLGSVRHTTAGHARGLKTRQAAAKRFIKTGKGKLKHGHAGRSHLSGHYSRTRMRRLNVKSIFSGTIHKNMNRLILTGK
jgi:large subunit ribosomal protein L35